VLTCAFAKRSDALACSEVFVASDRIRPNTTRWRSFAGMGSASAAASAARASASISIKYAVVQPQGEDPHPVRDQQRRCVRRRDSDDGMVKIEAVLHFEEAELVWTMLDHAATQLAREIEPSAGDDPAASWRWRRPPEPARCRR
jgi:hypothetical protein